MSWDIVVQDIPADARAVDDIPDDFEPRALGTRSDLLSRIMEVVPNVDFSNPAWGVVESPELSVEFNMGEDEEVMSFALHVRGGEAAAGLVADLLNRCGWRAFDPSSDTGLFEASGAVESLRKWQAYRDRLSDRGSAV
ncbi:MAG: hypothetical protein HS104_03150 [Polyangiaceae bacterium]|nr:hypothetical protein [Polyangiaceae bacterium]